MTPDEGRKRDRIQGAIWKKVSPSIPPGISPPRFHEPGDGYRAAWLLLVKLWHKFATSIVLPAWYGSPFHFWGNAGYLWGAGTVLPDSWERFFNDRDADARPPGWIRAPFGGLIEAIFRRRRRCVSCGKFFWRQCAWIPLAGVNIFEEHCSKACSDEGWADADLPY